MSVGISVQHSVASFLSKFPSSYQFNNHGNVGHRGFHICLRVDSLQ